MPLRSRLISYKNSFRESNKRWNLRTLLQTFLQSQVAPIVAVHYTALQPPHILYWVQYINFYHYHQDPQLHLLYHHHHHHHHQQHHRHHHHQQLLCLPLLLPRRPPPPPAVAPPKDWRLNLPKRKKGPNSGKKESNTNPGISLADIKGVKLKKVDRKNKKSGSSTAGGGGPLVTLLDLQAVQLKKSFKHPTQSTQITSPMNLRTRLSLEAIEFRTSLKRVGFPRSPGGTPLRTKPAESGVGLTPIMTRALKRKFRSVTTPHRSPCSSDTSPATPPGFRI
ncbi:proline-rich protein 11-like [Strongylocentrotus purpuratus]|uniref:Uncharacterized protein n=1 Tax=Strongylocentrotus purpuratus TaxID=7668 RepID=A0A7M7PA71_STRPU|nr:proline-rich protein 11-like [Strongylocentrotus purpuratus]